MSEPRAVAESSTVPVDGAVREPSGLRVWGPTVIGIPLWLFHQSALAGLTRHSCLHPGTNWFAHAVTALAAALTIGAMALCETLRRRGTRAIETAGATQEAAVEEGHTLVFIGWLGLAIGAFSLALILYEGSWALTVPPCHG